MKSRKRLSVLTTLFLLQAGIFATTASAQSKDINSLSIFLKTLLKNLGVHSADIVSIIIGIIAVVMLLPTTIKHIKGDTQSQDAFLRNGTGIFLGFITIEFCRILFT